MKSPFKRFWPNDLRGRLTVLVLAALVPMVIAQAAIFGYWYSTRKSAELQSNLELARTFGALYERYLSDLQHAELTLGEALLRLEPEPALALLESRAKNYPAIHSFTWANPEGKILLSSRAGAPGISVADREYFREIIRGKQWTISDLLITRVGGDERLVLARAVRSGERLLGVVLGEIVPERLGETLTARRSRGGILALFDRTGRIISIVRGPDVRATVPSSHHVDRMAQEVIRSGQDWSGFLRFAGEGVDRLAARTPLPGLGWAAGASRPFAEVMAPVRRNLFLVLLVVLTICLASFLLAEFVGRSIINSVAVVREGAATLAAGSEARVAIPQIQELADLARTFNHMAEQLTQHTASLERAAEDLRRSNQELEAFSYSVSHDLRAPLRAIDGFSHALMEDYSEQLPQDAQRYLNIIRDNTQRMGQLIDDLLAYSRLGRREPNFEMIDMQALTRMIAENLKAAGETGTAVLQIGDMPRAYGDRTLIGQVLSNLLSNAFKFSSTQEQPRVEVSGREEPVQNVYWVRDNGVGFDMSYQHKLFGIFQRLHSMNEFPGTGVGLATVQRLLQKHGGRVWAESAVGKGATFYIALPRRQR
ncbi:MAG: HAMP domain-containing protein [Acidobacteria bacterium]|nr:MAG: HAMP domain-containing protein [Acidobacteriota bacterium]